MIQSNPKATPTPKNVAQITESVKIGRAIIVQGKTKVEAVRAMYPLIKDETREVIWKAFEEGASLTPKGAVTYLYNAEREYRKNSSKPNT
jgi:propanediol dehydratase small subunit